KASLGPDHPNTIRSMNNLAGSYIDFRESAKAMAILKDALAMRERRVKADPGNSLEKSLLAWTHGQIGGAEERRLDFSAAVQAYRRSVDLFTKLDQAGVLKDPTSRGHMKFFRHRLA